jgi:hypothetical protein
MPEITPTTKTIRMPRAIWEAWEAGLTDPNVKQATGVLFDGKGYCCLGVLQKVVDGEVERLTEEMLKAVLEEDPTALTRVGDSALAPTIKWLKSKGIQFWNQCGTDSSIPSVMVRDGGYSPSLVSELNDEGYSFAQILELMRPHVLLTD